MLNPVSGSGILRSDHVTSTVGLSGPTTASVGYDEKNERYIDVDGPNG
jgi:hypothetical protein